MGKNNNGIKIVFKKLLKSLSFFAAECEETKETNSKNSEVPEDVKEGHVAVLAMANGDGGGGGDDDEPKKRFIVPLNYLTRPSFIRLLQKAAEEYGFDHEGALTIPCRPSELERILADLWREERHDDDDDDDDDDSRVNVKWGSYWNPLVQSF